jgi:hypothetical protein
MAETTSGSPASAEVRKWSFVPGAKGFILWLGGSLAGLTAILYTAGYLVTRAHLSMLGLYGVVDFGGDYFVQEGAKFFLVVGYSFGRSAVLPLLELVGATAVAVMTLRYLLWRTRVKRWCDNLRARCPDLGADGPLRAIAFVLLFFLFLEHSETALVKFQLPLCITNLLYTDSGTAKCGPSMQEGAKSLKAALLHRDDAVLTDAFFDLMYRMAQATLLAYMTWWAVPPRRWRSWFVAPPLVAALLIYVISLPMDYGVLLRPIAYPRITLALDEKAAFAIAGPLYLLSKTANDFVVWDASVRKLFWIPSGSVKRAEVGGVYDLFASAPEHAASESKK